MSGSHTAHTASKSNPNAKSRSKSSSSAWKIWVLVAALVVAVAVLGFLVYQLVSGGFLGSLGGGSSDNGGTANIAPGVFAKVDAKYGNGQSVAGNITVNPGTQRPDTIPPEAEDVVLLDITWEGESELAEPVYLTVSDSSFTDGDGLAVYHYNDATAQWDTFGPYRIQNNSVTFQVASLSPFAFQVISSDPQPTATPEVVATPEPSPEPSPEPTPEPVAVVDYGNYPTVQNGVFTQAGDFEDDHTYVVALVQNMTGTEAPTEAAPEDSGDETDVADDGGVDITYVDAPDATEDGDDATVAPEAAASQNAPKATVLMNLDGQNMRAVDMPLLQADDGTWYLGGPITEGMLWTANRDYYSGDYRYSLANHDRYINIDDAGQAMTLTDNSIRTRWLVQTAKLADGTEISTLNYRDSDKYYVSSLGMEYQVLTDAMFPAGTLTEGATVSSPAFLGGAVPADQSLLREQLHFAVSKEESQALQLVLFELDSDRAVPEDVETVLTHRVTVPMLDGFSNLGALDVRDGDKVLQLGTDYTVAARVFNNSTVAVVITFTGNYSGQIVRTYAGTTFRTDASQPTPAPEATPSPTPAPTQPPSGGGTSSGGNSSGGNNTSGGSTNNDPATNTDTSGGGSGNYEDPDPASNSDTSG